MGTTPSTSPRAEGRGSHFLTRAWLAVALLASLAACSPAGPSPETPFSGEQQDGAPAQASPAPSVVPITPGACENAALFSEDVTIPDGTVVGPGELIEKKWSLQNVGTCDWGPGYRLVKIEGDDLAGGDLLSLYPARAGTAAVLEVSVRAPSEPGTYRSVWQAQSPGGDFFGDAVYMLVVVEQGGPASSPAP